MNCVMCKKEVASDKGYYIMGEIRVCFECAAKYTLDSIFIHANNEAGENDGVGIDSVFSPAIVVSAECKDETSEQVEYKDATPEQVEAFFASEHETPEFWAGDEKEPDYDAIPDSNGWSHTVSSPISET